jgi:hypothetical protein
MVTVCAATVIGYWSSHTNSPGTTSQVHLFNNFLQPTTHHPPRLPVPALAPKKLFSLLPVILVTAITKAAKKSVTSNSSYGPFGAYECPVYKYPARTDRYIIFSVLLATMNHKPLHWTLRASVERKAYLNRTIRTRKIKKS